MWFCEIFEQFLSKMCEILKIENISTKYAYIVT